VECRFDMQSGKFWARASTLAAVGWRLDGRDEEESYAESGAVKERERWAKMGERRSSSSRRGSAFAVAYGKY